MNLPFRDPATGSPLLQVKLGCAAAALALVAGSCSPGRAPARPMQLRVIEGTATLHRDGGSETIRSEAGVRTGDRIVLSQGGIAELRLAGERSFELSSAGVRILTTDRVALDGGSILAVLADPAVIDAGGVEARSRNAAMRVDRGLSTRAAVYEGEMALTTAAGTLNLPRLRQAVVAGGDLPGRELPIRLDPRDRWDRRFLQVVIDLDDRLTSFGRGLEAQLGRAEGLEFFANLLPTGVDRSFLLPFLGGRRSDLVIGLAVAVEGAADQPQRVSERLGRAVELWGQGASWGLIAFEFGVGANNLFDRLLDAVRRAGLFAPGAVPGLAVAAPPGGPPGPPASPPGPGPAPSPSPTPSPSPSPSPDPVQDLIDDILGLLPPPPLP